MTMAERASDDLIPFQLCEELLSCAVCYDPFSDDRVPKALPCLHTFCSSCLSSSIEEHRKRTARCREISTKAVHFFPCPVCKEEATIPPNGAAGFKDDFRIRRLSEALLRCQQERSKREQAVQCRSTPVPRKCDMCKVFNNEDECLYTDENAAEAEKYCLQCYKLFCGFCAETHQQSAITSGHVLLNMDSLSPSCKPPNGTACAEHSEQLLLFFCRDCRVPLCMVCTLADRHESHDIGTLSKEAERLKAETLAALDTAKTSEESLAEELDHADKLLKELRIKEKVAREAILSKTLREIFRVRHRQSKMETELEVLCAEKYKVLDEQKEKLRKIKSTMRKESETMQVILQNGENIQILNLLNALRVDNWQMREEAIGYHQWSGSGITDLGKYETLVVDQENFNMRDPELIQTDIVEEIRCVVTQMQTLSTTGSEAESSNQLMEKIGTRGNREGEFSFPAGVASLPGGGFAVADMHNHRVQIFESDGRFVRSFGEQNSFKPCGITSTREGNLAVTDCCSDGASVKIFTAEGDLKKTIGLGEMEYPFSVAIDGKGRYIVCDSATNRVLVYKPNGTKDRHFNTNTKFGFYVTVNHRNEILLSDWFNHCIKVFDPDGTLKSKIGSKGYGDGELMMPLGLCQDNVGNILVLDCKCARISMFTPDGRFLRHVIGPVDDLSYSRAIAVSQDNHIFVTSGDNRRDIPNQISIYNL